MAVSARWPGDDGVSDAAAAANACGLMVASVTVQQD